MDRYPSVNSYEEDAKIEDIMIGKNSKEFNSNCRVVFLKLIENLIIFRN